MLKYCDGVGITPLMFASGSNNLVNNALAALHEGKKLLF